ncbi:MAG TPA: rhombosortase [Opitutaceae bacterium]|nr:rhombosortase [Opitutaceae bacterium]
MVRKILAPDRLPWAFLAVGVASLVVQLHPSWRGALVYDRAGVGRGEWWRIWTGHLVHFGWPHFVADTGLFLILGRLLERPHPFLSRFALVTMPAVISLSLYWFDPGMTRYGGLSAVNLGLLVFLACLGWQRNWVDWFWPAVLLIYVGEIVLESHYRGGRGGGMIAFDDPTVRVATAAHIPGAVFGVLLWAASWKRRGNPAASG